MFGPVFILSLFEDEQWFKFGGLMNTQFASCLAIVCVCFDVIYVVISVHFMMFRKYVSFVVFSCF